MIALCRAGFERVEFVRPAACRSAHRASPVLLVVGRQPEADLVSLLRRTYRLLSRGGVLVVELQHPADDRLVRSVLERLGLAVVRTRSSGRLVGLTLQPGARIRAAA